MIALVQTTFPDEETAAGIAGTLIEERLAACANLTPCRSLYRWQGALEDAREVSATFKTLPNRIPMLRERLSAQHPYDLPAIEWWTASADPAVIAWISAAVS